MTLYSIVLFLHLASVLGPFATLSFEVLSLFRLRQALDLPEVRRWIDPVPGLPLVAMASILIVFFSGIFLTVRLSAFDTAWPKVTIGALLLIAPLGAVLGVPFPTGLRLIGKDSPSLVPWAWAVNGFFTVIGSVLATILAMAFGFTAVHMIAAGCYALALLAIRKSAAPEARLSRERISLSTSVAYSTRGEAEAVERRA